MKKYMPQIQKCQYEFMNNFKISLLSYSQPLTTISYSFYETIKKEDIKPFIIL